MHPTIRNLKSLFLTQGRTLKDEVKRPLRITCLEGRLWLTHPDLGQDLVLTSDESKTIDAVGLLVIEAMQDSRLILGPVASPKAPAAIKPLRQSFRRTVHFRSVGVHRQLAQKRTK